MTVRGTGTAVRAFPPGAEKEAHAFVDLSFNGKTFFQYPLHACGKTIIKLPLSLGEAEVNAPPCPLPVGTAAAVNGTMTIPEIAPAGQYSLYIAAHMPSGSVLSASPDVAAGSRGQGAVRRASRAAADGTAKTAEAHRTEPEEEEDEQVLWCVQADFQL